MNLKALKKRLPMDASWSGFASGRIAADFDFFETDADRFCEECFGNELHGSATCTPTASSHDLGTYDGFEIPVPLELTDSTRRS